MREIKFRAWDKTNNEYYMNGDAFDLNFSGSYGDFFFDNDHPGNMRDVKLVWEQFTGLKEKNGKEIYENSIVKTPKANWRVVWGPDMETNPPGYVGWIMRSAEDNTTPSGKQFGSNELFDWYPSDGNKLTTIEVIGNIHENRNLLDEG